MKKALYIIFILIIVSIIFLNILSITNSSLFGYRLFKVMTGSMEPTINVNSLILIKEQKSYKVNDIITFKSKNSYVTHRIVSIEEDKVITKGDNNNTEDKPISKKDIVGKLVRELKVYGFIMYLLSNPITWALIISIFLISLSINGNKERQKNG